MSERKINLEDIIEDNNMTPKEAVELAKAGSQKAFTLLYNTHYRAVYLNIYNIVKNKDVADDLASETFLKAFKGIDKFTKDISFEMWLKTIANHHSIDFIRSNKKNEQNIYIDDELSAEFIHTDNTTPETALIQKESIEKLEGKIKEIGPRQKEVLRLRCEEGLQYKDIALRLGLSTGTVKHYIYRYRQTLSQTLIKTNPKKDENKSIVFSRNKILS